MMPDELEAGKYRTPAGLLEISKCRTCGRDIIWTISPAGARLPLDARPCDPHVYAIAVLDVVRDGGPRAIKIQAVISDETLDVDGQEPDKIFISHWLTCPRPPGRVSTGGGPAPRRR